MPHALQLAAILAHIQFNSAQIVALVLAVVALFMSGFISGSEISFFSLTDQQIREIEEDDPSTADTIRRLIGKPERLLATILIANNLVNVSIVVLTNYALGPIFQGMGEVLSFILQSVLLTFLILLFGEILPKLYSNNYPLRWACFAAPALMAITRLFSPLSRMLVSSTFIVKKVVTKQHHNISTDELSQALNIADGAAGPDKQMLEDILKFGNTVASEIMTPRISMVGVDASADFDQVMRTVVDTGYSRLPVYRDSMDEIIGVLYSRDLLPYVQSRPANFDWHTLLRKPFYVPEGRNIDDLLEDFRKLKIHLAFVIDEFGGTQGLVTMEDVLEEIVGDIDDEYDEDDKIYSRVAPGVFDFEGRAPLTDFFRITGIPEEPFETHMADAETLAGLLLDIKGDFPRPKETITFGSCKFTILSMDNHRIATVRVDARS